MDTLTLDVTAVVAGGDGLARDADGRVVFVSGALPGEAVEAEIVRRRKDYASAVAVEVLRPSEDRATPPCPFVAAGCGGCDWQHITPAGQRRLKGDIVRDALRRLGHLEVEVALGRELAATGYRTTMSGVAVDGRFALRHRGTHDLVPVDPCLVAHPLIADLIEEGRFGAGEVVLRAGARTGERLVVAASAPEHLPPGVRVVTDAELRGGTRAWYHEEVGGRRWRISARSFFQARPDGAEALVDAVRVAVADVLPSARHLVDLYGGVGLLAGGLAPSGRITLVESGASSIADARVNLADLQVRLVKADVARWRPSAADVVIADPPRAGLGRAGVAAVAGTGARRLALVSCDPAALGRDARLLAEVGFELRTVSLVDLFPHTSHVETVSRFDRS